MKRNNVKNKGIALLLVITLAAASMSGCGEKKTEPAPEINFNDITGNSGDNADNPQEENSGAVESSVEQEPVEETREGMYRSEITNEWIDESLKNQRPVAIMVDNEKTALPHYGLTEADVVYEIMNSTANGRITRLMAIVKDWGKIQQFGSVRSTRPTNIMLAAEWNAVLCHDGGPFYIDEWIAKNILQISAAVLRVSKMEKHMSLQSMSVRETLTKNSAHPNIPQSTMNIIRDSIMCSLIQR